MATLPKATQAMTIRKSPLKNSRFPYDAILEEVHVPTLKKGQILVRIGAAAFNHMDVWIRKGQYPHITLGSAFGADGAGTVIATYESNDPFLNKRVFIIPNGGWEKHPEAPEFSFGIIGAMDFPLTGTFTHYVVVERDRVMQTPEHLTDVQASAWPVGGVTAWRAAVVNGHVEPGQNVLITGIGGGVALTALQLCVAIGANVFVTSGHSEKIQKAISLGAKGGVNYKDKDWPIQLAVLLQKIENNSHDLDLVIDSGGGDIMMQIGTVLKQGGRVVCYGMTASTTVGFTMREVLKNQRLIGSTLGSNRDLVDATNFLTKHHIVPVISHVLDGLGNAEKGFEIMGRAHRFGKVVINIGLDGFSKEVSRTKL